MEEDILKKLGFIEQPVRLWHTRTWKSNDLIIYERMYESYKPNMVGMAIYRQYKTTVTWSLCKNDKVIIKETDKSNFNKQLIIALRKERLNYLFP